MEDLLDRQPAHALVAGVDLLIVRFDSAVSVLYGRCLYRGALMADGRVEGDNLICGVHDRDYRLDSGVSAYNQAEALQKFTAWVEGGAVCVDARAPLKPWAYRATNCRRGTTSRSCRRNCTGRICWTTIL